MGSNAEYYRDAFNVGAIEQYRSLVETYREEAEQTNKSVAERRKALQRTISDMDKQIASAQTAAERIETTHFNAHMKARTASVRASASRSGARTKSANAIEKARKKMRTAVNRSIGDASNLAKTQEGTTYDAATALESIAQEPSVLGVLGEYGLGRGGTGPVDPAIRAALAVGMEEGLTGGIGQYSGEEPNSADVMNTVQRITGVTPDLAALNQLSVATGNRVAASASAGVRGISSGSVDKMIEESGLLGSLKGRQQEIVRLQQEQRRLRMEAAGLPGDITEEEILSQAAGRMGEVARRAGQGGNIISSYRRMKEVRGRLKEEQEKATQLEAQRAAIESMSPSQRILMQQTFNAMDLTQRHPQGIPPEMDREVRDLGDKIATALINDPSLKGNYKRVVEMAVHLAEQTNPEGSVESIRAMRDRILESAVFLRMKKQRLTEHVPPKKAPPITELVNPDDFDKLSDNQRREMWKRLKENPEDFYTEAGKRAVLIMGGSDSIIDDLGGELDEFKTIRDSIIKDVDMAGTDFLQKSAAIEETVIDRERDWGRNTPEGWVPPWDIRHVEDAMSIPRTSEIIEGHPVPEGYAGLPLDPELEELLAQRAQ